jgi:hypothetical protein
MFGLLHDGCEPAKAAGGLRRRMRLTLALVTSMAFFALPASAAFAGNFLATGHDADLHCSSGQDQCHYLLTAVNFARAAAPNPNLPVLVIDPGTEVATALDNISTTLGVPAIPRVVVDPQSAAFASTAFSVSSYSAIIVASDASCGGCDLNATASLTSQTPDSDAINARSADITSFFNAGGGLLYLAGASHGDGSAGNPQTYYSSVPVGITGLAVSNPFTLTPAGQTLGFQDASAVPPIGTHNDINCCATHNSFAAPPAGSPIQVAERDSTGNAETIFVAGSTIGGGGFGSDKPITATGRTLSAVEGASANVTTATFSDPDTAATASEYSATINWGDGSTSAGTIAGSGGSFTVTGSHKYAEEGSYSVTVTINDPDTASNTATVTDTATVADAALHATGVTASSRITFGGTVATFGDDDPAGTVSDYTASIDWGDGKTTSGTISASTGKFLVGGNHTYKGPGTYHVTVRIRDKGGSTATATTTLTIYTAAGVARVSVPQGCLSSGSFDLTVQGARIASVTATLDGNSIKTKTVHRGSSYRVRVQLSRGSHKVRVTVKYLTSSHTASKTVSKTVSRCAPPPTPHFTG